MLAFGWGVADSHFLLMWSLPVTEFGLPHSMDVGFKPQAATERERETDRSHDSFHDVAQNVPSWLSARRGDRPEGHMGLEILLELVLENTICHVELANPLPASLAPEQPRGSKE